MSEIKPKNYYVDVLQNPDYFLTREKPVFKKVITPAYSIEQMQEVKHQLDIALDALTEISKSTVNELRANFWDDDGEKSDLVTVKSKDAKIAEKALEEIGEN